MGHCLLTFLTLFFQDSNFFLSQIEIKIFKTTITKPKINVHNVDIIFIATHSYDEINELKQILEKKNVLNFTTKLNIDEKKQTLSLMNLQTPLIIRNSLHLHMKSLTMTIPSYVTNTVKISF